MRTHEIPLRLDFLSSFRLVLGKGMLGLKTGLGRLLRATRPPTWQRLPDATCSECFSTPGLIEAFCGLHFPQKGMVSTSQRCQRDKELARQLRTPVSLQDLTSYGSRSAGRGASALCAVGRRAIPDTRTSIAWPWPWSQQIAAYSPFVALTSNCNLYQLVGITERIQHTSPKPQILRAPFVVGAFETHLRLLWRLP